MTGFVEIAIEKYFLCLFVFRLVVCFCRDSYQRFPTKATDFVRNGPTKRLDSYDFFTILHAF